MRAILVVALVAGCGGVDAGAPVAVSVAAPRAAASPDARIPRAPGAFAPSLVALRGPLPAPDAPTLGATLADVDSCAACHPDAAAQWAASAHSFASFGNPIYRFDVEQARADLGKPASQHCGGCHDLPLLVDGLMTGAAPIPPDDLRAHSGVTCRLCHGVAATTLDGNGSYVLATAPLDAPRMDDPASIARHRAQVTTKVDAELCVGCHRGFASPDLGVPVHLVGVDDTGAWESSPYTGNGTGRVDRVAARTCIDCHMARQPASPDELGAKHGTIASHRFVGGHTWMAAMRGDAAQLRATQEQLVGAASIDVAGARVVTGATRGPWLLPADGAPARPGSRLELDVVLRNLRVGHRFPGGLADVQDTWVELTVADRAGRVIAESGRAHADDPDDTDAHVLRTLAVEQDGAVQDEHRVAAIRAQVAPQTLAPREAQGVRYAFTVPASLASSQLPLTVTARLRHRSRSLRLQAAACRAAQTPDGAAFLAGARGARSVTLDPCAPQPITLVAETAIEIGAGARARSPRPAWERAYELGMALAATIVLRLDEADAVLAIAAAGAPGPRERAMVAVQRGWVAARLGRVAEAIADVAAARADLTASGAPAPGPAVLDAVTADAFVRANRWAEAVAPARACTERAPKNAAAWGVYASVLVAVGDHRGALAATAKGLALAPRDPELLRAQATSLAALRDPQAAAAQAASTRYRAPEEAPGLRIRCAARSARCARDRNPVHTLELRPVVSGAAAR